MTAYTVQVIYYSAASHATETFTVVRNAKDAGTAISIVTSLFNALSNYKDENDVPFIKVVSVSASNYSPA